MAFVLCLDTLANSDELYMHVSRPPKPDTSIHSFIQQLEEVFTANLTTSLLTSLFTFNSNLNVVEDQRRASNGTSCQFFLIVVLIVILLQKEIDIDVTKSDSFSHNTEQLHKTESDK